MLVKDVKFKDNKVVIYLDDGSFFISKENYIENPISIDSFIDQKRIDYLLERENFIMAKITITKMLNRKVMSIYAIKSKLKEMGLNNKEIKELVDSLERMGLLNDDYYTSLKVENLLFKRKGKIEIKKELLEEKIGEDIIDKYLSNIDEETYVNNFNKVKEKYLKMYVNKSYKVREQMVRVKLKEYGYEEEFINNLEINKNISDELVIAKKELFKILKNKEYDLSNSVLVNKIRAKLMAKGFSYDIINRALEEVKENETY